MAAGGAARRFGVFRGRALQSVGHPIDSVPMLTEAQQTVHSELGIPADYGADGSLPAWPDAETLVDVGPNLIGRMQQLTPAAAERWHSMVDAARDDGHTLMIVSGFRSFAYQASLIRKKLGAGQVIGDILKVNAAPGYSQHHTGAAVDVATPGSRPLTEEFEQSGAFDWLTGNAARFGFTMTYPRNNKYGFIYEPWHWALEP